jgi:hypothetical protein
MGAGASKPFGYPLTGEMLPKLRRYIGDGTLSEWGYRKSEIAQLKKGLSELLPGITRCKPAELPLVTDVLTLIDHSVATGTALLRGWSNDRVREFRGLIEQVIADMVTPDGIEATRMLKRFSRVLRRGMLESRLGVITTNYDIEVELELFDRIGEENVASLVDFGMSWREPAEEIDRVYPRPDSPSISYYKLHGSLNWLRCPLCEFIYVNVYGVVVWHAWEKQQTPLNTCHCGHWPLQSVLVTPSYVRDTRETNLIGIWRNALDFLAAADKWLIVGYSLPPEDIAIRTLLLKAYRLRQATGRRPPLRIWVVQGPGREQRQRYKLLFPKAEYHDTGMQTFDYNVLFS